MQISLLAICLVLVSCGVTQNSQLNETLPILRSGPHGIEFSLIPDGHFQMGSPGGEQGREESEKQYWVKLTQEYWMQTTEVTRRQWRSVMGSYPDNTGRCLWRDDVITEDDHPAVCVSWDDVQRFIGKLNNQNESDDIKYRLPTEAEWEFATRGYTETAYSLQQPLNLFAWNHGNSGNRTHPVRALLANKFGLYDVHGNVEEWVLDWEGVYPIADQLQNAVKDPIGKSSGRSRIIRGGSFKRGDGCRSASRRSWQPHSKFYDIGFRVVRTSN